MHWVCIGLLSLLILKPHDCQIWIILYSDSSSMLRLMEENFESCSWSWLIVANLGVLIKLTRRLTQFMSKDMHIID